MHFDNVRNIKASPAAQDVSEVQTILLCSSLILRTGLTHLLSGTCFHIVDGIFDSPSTLPNFSPDQPVLIIVSIGYRAGDTSGIIKQLKEKCPAAWVVVLDDQLDLEAITRAYAAGADGFLVSTTGRGILIKSLELIMLGERVFPAAAVLAVRAEHQQPESSQRKEGADAPANPLPSQIANLSRRELEILNCLTEGAQNKVIARNLNLAEATVKIHVKAILKKLGVKNRTQAAILAASYTP